MVSAEPPVAQLGNSTHLLDESGPMLQASPTPHSDPNLRLLQPAGPASMYSTGGFPSFAGENVGAVAAEARNFAHGELGRWLGSAVWSENVGGTICTYLQCGDTGVCRKIIKGGITITGTKTLVRNVSNDRIQRTPAQNYLFRTDARGM